MTPLSSQPGCETDAKPRRNYAIMILRVAASICVITFTVFVLLHSMGMPWTKTGIHFLASFLYSAFIALPTMFILRSLSIFFTDKLPRLVHWIQASALICTAVMGCLAATFVLQLIGVFPKNAYWQEFRSSVEFAIIITLLIGMSTTAYETMRYRLQATTLELRTRQVEQERAYKLLAEAQLSSLESRIHPHFLFNTLNSIAALIPSDPVRAEDTVSKLASLLRFSLNANHSSLVPLRQELKIVRDYLEIEKTRFGARLRFEIAVPESLGEAMTPPLALQSLVENAVKHVAAQRAEWATIRVQGRASEAGVVLEVIDDGPGFTLESTRPEHGLGNLQARLELLFGATGELAVARENNRTVVRMTIPFAGEK